MSHNAIRTSREDNTHHDGVYASTTTRRGSHGSQGKSAGGIKGVLHKIADKVHPYNTQLEVSLYSMVD